MTAEPFRDLNRLSETCIFVIVKTCLFLPKQLTYWRHMFCFLFVFFLFPWGESSADTHSWLGESLDVLGLRVSDEVVVQDHIRLQAQHFPPYWQQQQPGIAVGEVVAEEFGVFKMQRLQEETAEIHQQKQNKTFSIPRQLHLLFLLFFTHIQFSLRTNMTSEKL